MAHPVAPWRGRARRIRARGLWGPLYADRLGILPWQMPDVTLREWLKIDRYFEAERRAVERQQRDANRKRGRG